MQSVSWDGPVGLHGPGSVDAHELQVLANMAMTGAAGRAIVARIERHHRHRIAHRKALHSRSQRANCTGHFMPYNLR